MNPELLRARLARGEVAIGIMLSEMYVPNIARLLAGCGYDFLLVDCEHGYFDMTQVANLIAVARGAEIPVIVRVTQPSRTSITKYLDMGAQGILLSDVASRADAERLAALCRYAPEGDRGVSTFRAHTDYSIGNVSELMRSANEQVIVICQIESPGTVSRIDEITAIPGVDGVLVGPNDLSQHMGIFGQYEHPAMTDALQRVADSARAYGKWSGVITANGKLLSTCRSMGMTCFSVGSELNAIHNGAVQQLDCTRKLLNQEERKP